MPSNMSEWTTVPYRKHKPRRLKQPVQPSSNIILDEGKTYDKRSILDLAKSILKTEWGRSVLVKITEAINTNRLSCQYFEFQEIVCYGLGRPSSSTVSAHQLSLLVVLHTFINKCNWSLSGNKFWDAAFNDTETDLGKLKPSGDHIACHIYDPTFLDTDNQLLKDLGFVPLETNEFGRRKAKKTLFYMLHCDKWLYNNLLWTNWSMVDLTNSVIIGNSFQSMYDRTPSRILGGQYKYIYLAVKHSLLREFSLQDWNKHDNIFNDTSIITFPKELAQNINCCESRDENCPVYEDQTL